MACPLTSPMLASPLTDFNKLRFPCIASYKLDGIRFVKIGGQGLTRNLNLIPNDYIRTMLENLCPDGIDGEIIVGHSMQDCTSAVMSKDGRPDFTLWALDLVTNSLERPYYERLDDLYKLVNNINDKHIQYIPTYILQDLSEFYEFENKAFLLGYEGIIVRDFSGPYKCGRATENEGWLLKFKRFLDSEAVIIGFKEQIRKANKVRKGILGKFIARDEVRFPGVDLKIATGKNLTTALRRDIWNNQEIYLGKIINYRYQGVGTTNAPRFPTWHSFRHSDDT